MAKTCKHEFMIQPEEKLPYPLRPLKTRGGTVEEYIIPDDEKAKVLKRLYPFKPVPTLDEVLLDLHAGKKFRVGNFRVTRENEVNYLVSPYYPSSGGTVMDWMPSDSSNKKKNAEDVTVFSTDWELV